MSMTFLCCESGDIVTDGRPPLLLTVSVKAWSDSLISLVKSTNSLAQILAFSLGGRVEPKGTAADWKCGSGLWSCVADSPIIAFRAPVTDFDIEGPSLSDPSESESSESDDEEDSEEDSRVVRTCCFLFLDVVDCFADLLRDEEGVGDSGGGLANSGIAPFSCANTPCVMRLTSASSSTGGLLDGVELWAESRNLAGGLVDLLGRVGRFFGGILQAINNNAVSTLIFCNWEL